VPSSTPYLTARLSPSERVPRAQLDSLPDGAPLSLRETPVCPILQPPHFVMPCGGNRVCCCCCAAVQVPARKRTVEIAFVMSRWTWSAGLPALQVTWSSCPPALPFCVFQGRGFVGSFFSNQIESKCCLGQEKDTLVRRQTCTNLFLLSMQVPMVSSRRDVGVPSGCEKYRMAALKDCSECKEGLPLSTGTSWPTSSEGAFAIQLFKKKVKLQNQAEKMTLIRPVFQVLHTINGKCSEAASDIRNTCVRRISCPSSLVSGAVTHVHATLYELK
jgi:hypothetical protein